MEAFAVVRALVTEAAKPRPTATDGAGFLAALNSFDILEGAEKASAATAAAEPPAITVAATAPGPGARSDDIEKAAPGETALDPALTAFLTTDPSKPPVTFEASFIRNEDLAADDGNQPQGPAQAKEAAAAAFGRRAPIADTVRVRSFSVDAPALAEPVAARSDRAVATPNRAPPNESSAAAAAPTIEPPSPAQGPSFEDGRVDGSAPETTSVPDSAGPAPSFVERTLADNAKPEKAPQPAAAPFALEGGGVSETVPLRVNAPAAAETPALPLAAADAAPARTAPFELATITRRTDGGLEIRLDPPDLGAVSIQFFEDDAGALQASITTDRGETLDLLRRHSDFLQRELARQGAGDFTLSFSDRRDGGAQAQENGARDRRTFRFGETPEALVSNLAPRALLQSADRIDLIA